MNADNIVISTLVVRGLPFFVINMLHNYFCFTVWLPSFPCYMNLVPRKRLVSGKSVLYNTLIGT